MGAEKIALTVSPPLVEMAVAPGGDRGFEVTVSNDGDRRITAEAQVADLELDREGGPHPLPAGASPWSAAPWVSLSAKTLSLAPGESRRVACRVRVPRGQVGGRYGVLLLSTQSSAAPDGRSMSLRTQTGCVLLLTAARTERRQAQVSALEVSREASGDLTFEVRLRNTGNAHLRAAGDLLVRGADRRIAARLKLEGGTGTVLPSGERAFIARWPGSKAKPGAYHAEARLSAPGLRSVSGGTGFTVEGESARP